MEMVDSIVSFYLSIYFFYGCSSAHIMYTACLISLIIDTGLNGINVWKNVWQCSTDSPPVESDGGESTAGLHWDEACMVAEVSKYEIISHLT